MPGTATSWAASGPMPSVQPWSSCEDWPGAPGPVVASDPFRPGLPAERVARAEAARRAQCGTPARPVVIGARNLLGVGGADAGGARVEAQPGDDQERVAGVRVDREPLALAARAPAHERRRVERALQQAGEVQRVGDGARAVIALVDEPAMPAAVAVREGLELVGGPDRVLDGGRRIGG